MTILHSLPRLFLDLGALALSKLPATVVDHVLPVPPVQAKPLNLLPVTSLDDLEKRTQQYLGAIREQLRRRSDTHVATPEVGLRMALMRLSMWGPLAPFSSRLLESLADHAGLRKAAWPLMPAVQWMSAPFLFAVETAGISDAQARNLGKVFQLAEDRRAQGFGVILDNVGDASESPAAAVAYKDYYLALMRHASVCDATDTLHLSVKLSALTYDLPGALHPVTGAAKTRELKSALTDLLQTAADFSSLRVCIRIDMEEYAYKDLTLRLFRETVEEHPDIVHNKNGSLRLGVVIQAYLRDAAADIKLLAHWARQQGLCVPVRLVKGAYLLYEREAARRARRVSPVWDYKASTDANYEILSSYMLLQQDVLQPAFATHNIRSMARVMAVVEALKLDRSILEFQMLYGMGDPIKQTLVDMGYRLNEYIPAGSLVRGLKYAGRRFAELAGSDSALARTMRGDFSGAAADAPAFTGNTDIDDASRALGMLDGSRL